MLSYVTSMAKAKRCLRCAGEFDYEDGECPDCGWSSDEFRNRGRYGLERSGTGEWSDD
jgi:rRNA maturation endonuclease Nob1